MELGGAPNEQAAAKHELVLSSERAVEPLIQALASDRETKIRAEVAEILVSFTMRTADERIAAVLEKHLLNDPDPVVRGRIAEELGLRMRSEFFDLFLRAISDPSPLVQAPALLSLSGDAMGKLSDEQTQTLRRLAGERALSDDKEGSRGRPIPGGRVRGSIGRESARKRRSKRTFRKPTPFSQTWWHMHLTANRPDTTRERFIWTTSSAIAESRF